MTSAVSGKHVGQRRLVTEVEPGQFLRWGAEARSLGMTWAAWVRAVQDESVSMQEVIVFGVRAVGTDQIRFVGRTIKRLEQRHREGFTGKLAEWCSSCEWELVEFERTSVVHSAEAEARWVAELGGSGLLFNAGAGAGAPTGAVVTAVHLPREMHTAAVELACAGHWSLGAFVQLAVEQLIARMKAGQAVEVHAPGVARVHAAIGGRAPRWCSDCGLPQRSTVSGWVCANGEHGGSDSIFSAADAAAVRANSLSELPGFTPARSAPVRRVPSARTGSALNPHAVDAAADDDDDLDEVSA